MEVAVGAHERRLVSLDDVYEAILAFRCHVNDAVTEVCVGMLLKNEPSLQLVGRLRQIGHLNQTRDVEQASAQVDAVPIRHRPVISDGSHYLLPDLFGGHGSNVAV